MQTKYDRPALKLEFFESDFDDVYSFIKTRLNQETDKNTQIKNRTKGRAKEKQERKEKIVEKALAKKQTELAKDLEISIDELLKAKRNVIDLLQVKLKQYLWQVNEAWTIPVKDLKTLREMTKTELWEPTTIAKNEWKTEITWDWPLVQIIRADINKKE